MGRFRRLIREGLETRKFQSGQVRFALTTLHDPHIRLIIDLIAKTAGIQPSEVIQHIEDKKKEFEDVAKVAPLLYGTIEKNIVEDTVFKLFEKTPVQVDQAPKFNVVTFQKLMRSIRADHDEFLPLRSFIDRRTLTAPKIIFTKEGDTGPYRTVKTAAATPTGDFIFYVPFMEKLLQYAHLKQLTPKGRKYVGNGGDIPNEYGYIEFLIMHEFMHYSNDDFFYQKVIPNARQKIINWVGDFRSNYLLVKSGYEQLPIGLYNDEINYDRQAHYIDMYRLVEDEFKKLSKDQQEKVGGQLDDMSDDHEPGQQQGESEEVTGEATPADIDENAKTIERKMGEAKDSSEHERDAPATPPKAQPSGSPGTGKHDKPQGIDYSKIMPTFNWQTLIRRFVQSAQPRSEETYAKPHRRNVSGLDIARQVGASAIKPAEKPMDFSDVRLGFVIDSSGSMSGVITTVMSNVVNLMKTPVFRRSQVLFFRFSGSYEVYKMVFSTNQAGKVATWKDKPKYDHKATDLINQHFGAGTVFSASLAGEIGEALGAGYNMVFFLDSDILAGENLKNFLGLIKAAPKNVFVIFDTRDTYISFRQNAGVTTPNITYFQ